MGYFSVLGFADSEQGLIFLCFGALHWQFWLLSELFPCVLNASAAWEQVDEFVLWLHVEQIEQPEAERFGLCSGASFLEGDATADPVSDGGHCAWSFSSSPEDDGFPGVGDGDVWLEGSERLDPCCDSAVIWAHGEDGFEAWAVERHGPTVGEVGAELVHELLVSFGGVPFSGLFVHVPVDFLSASEIRGVRVTESHVRVLDARH